MNSEYEKGVVCNLMVHENMNGKSDDVDDDMKSHGSMLDDVYALANKIAENMSREDRDELMKTPTSDKLKEILKR